MSKSNIIKKGTIIQIESGGYSAFEVLGIFTALIDFDVNKILKEYKQFAGRYSMCRYGFISYLVKNGFIDDMCYGILDLGSSSGIKISWNPPIEAGD